MEQVGLQRPVGDPSDALRALEAEASRVRSALETARTAALSNPMTMEEPRLMAVAAKTLRDESRTLSPFLMARDNLVETLKGKRFALIRFRS